MDEKLKFIIELVKTKKKLHGMKIIYNKFKVAKEDRSLWKDLWNLVEGDINAGQKQGTTAGNGDSRASS